MNGDIDEEYIENVCDDLRCELLNLLLSKDQEDYDKASETINHVGLMIDHMLDDE